MYFIEFVTLLFLFRLCVREARGILAPPPRIKPQNPALEGRSASFPTNPADAVPAGGCGHWAGCFGIWSPASDAPSWEGATEAQATQQGRRVSLRPGHLRLEAKSQPGGGQGPWFMLCDIFQSQAV